MIQDLALNFAEQLRRSVNMAVYNSRTSSWTTNYQRYEFQGDSIWKFIVSTHLVVDHENRHAGLSLGRKSYSRVSSASGEGRLC